MSGLHDARHILAQHNGGAIRSPRRYADYFWLPPLWNSTVLCVTCGRAKVGRRIGSSPAAELVGAAAADQRVVVAPVAKLRCAATQCICTPGQNRPACNFIRTSLHAPAADCPSVKWSAVNNTPNSKPPTEPIASARRRRNGSWRGRCSFDCDWPINAHSGATIGPGPPMPEPGRQRVGPQHEKHYRGDRIQNQNQRHRSEQVRASSSTT